MGIGQAIPDVRETDCTTWSDEHGLPICDFFQCRDYARTGWTMREFPFMFRVVRAHCAYASVTKDVFPLKCVNIFSVSTSELSVAVDCFGGQPWSTAFTMMAAVPSALDGIPLPGTAVRLLFELCGIPERESAFSSLKERRIFDAPSSMRHGTRISSCVTGRSGTHHGARRWNVHVCGEIQGQTRNHARWINLFPTR